MRTDLLRFSPLLIGLVTMTIDSLEEAVVVRENTGLGAGSVCVLGGSKCSEYLFMRSSIFAFRRFWGILFILISSRDRSPCACSEY
jgi:hypothetical protein